MLTSDQNSNGVHQKTKLLELAVVDLIKTISKSAALIDHSYSILWAYDSTQPSQMRVLGRKCFSIFSNRTSPCEKCIIFKKVAKKKLQECPALKSEKSYHKSFTHPFIGSNGNISGLIRICFKPYWNQITKSSLWQNASNFIMAQEELKRLNIKQLHPIGELKKPLTIRETEILILATGGLSNNQIATILSITRYTVKSHLDNIYRKLGVHNRIMAAVWAIRNGLV